MAPEVPLPQAAYAPAESAAVFAGIARLAGEAVALGHAVIADAAFLREAERAAIAAAAAPFAGLWLEAPLDVLRGRVAARTGDASDATVGVLEAAAACATAPLTWTRLDARDPGAAARAALDLAPVVSP